MLRKTHYNSTLNNRFLIAIYLTLYIPKYQLCNPIDRDFGESKIKLF